MSRTKFIGILAVLATARGVIGAPVFIDYSFKGSFGADVPVTTVSAPNTLFTLAFTLPRQPTTPGPGIFGSDFSVSSAATLFLAGTQVPFPSTPIGFYSTQRGGGLDVLYSDGLDSVLFALSTPQLYSGTASSPIMLAGEFAVDVDALYSGFSVNNSDPSKIDFGFPTPVSLAAAVVAPEPEAWKLLALGITALLTRVYILSMKPK